MCVVLEVVRPVFGGTVVSATGRRVPKSASDRLIDSRVRVLVEMSERFAELLDPQNGPSGIRGTGGSVGLMPHEPRCLMLESAAAKRPVEKLVRPHCTCAYRSVVEFGRLVARLRDELRPVWWQLDGWWLSAEARTVWLCPRCGVCHQPEHRHPNRRSGRVSTVKCKRVLVWSRRAGARESGAREALEWMAREWDLASEPMLPDEFRVAA